MAPAAPLGQVPQPSNPLFAHPPLALTGDLVSASLLRGTIFIFWPTHAIASRCMFRSYALLPGQNNRSGNPLPHCLSCGRREPATARSSLMTYHCDAQAATDVLFREDGGLQLAALAPARPPAGRPASSRRCPPGRSTSW